MAGILDLLNSDLGKSIVSGVSREAGQPEDKTGDVLTMALPVLMQAMRRNASSEKGAEGLLGALNSKHNGSILDNLGDLFSGGVNQDVKDDGGKILGHVLGSRQKNVEFALSQKSGMDASSVANILKVAAPILMGVLGKEKQQRGVSDHTGLDGLLSGMLRSNAPQNEQSFLESILDADGDGSIVDDVAGMVLGSGSKKRKSGLGGLLGGLFGKK